MIPYARKIDGLHEIFFHITILLAFLAVITGGGTSLPMILLFPLGILAAALFQRAGKASPDHTRWWNVLIILVLIGTVLEYLTSPFADPIRLGVRFVLILTLIKLFSRQGERDEMQVYALSFLTLAAASSFNEDFFFGLIFGLYVLTGTFGLALFHLKNEAARHLQVRIPRKSPFDRLYIITLATISAAIFLSSLLIFFAFPRVGLGLFVEQSRQSLSVTGFSENISVGDHGSIRDNPAVVMRVEFEGDRPPDATSFKWRTMTFDTYEAGNWGRSHSNTESPASYRRSRDYGLEFLYSPLMSEHLQDQPALAMQIYLEPLGTNLLPTLWPASRIRLGIDEVNHLMGPASTNLTYDAYGDLRHTMRSEIGLTYRLEVAPAPTQELLHRRRGRSLPPAELARYLQLPENLDPRIEALAREITTNASSNFEKAEVIGAHFFREFDYTLDLPPVVGDDPVASFLFHSQRGHCEYFASAAAILLRTQGVPTRVVNGFLGGTWNEIGDYLTVRQGDAHAWIEVYVPELGWVPFEATPPIESSFLDRAGITRFLADATDAMRQTWMKWIIEYDLQSQAAMLRQLGRALSPGGSGATQDRPERSQEPDHGDGFPLRMSIFLSGWLLLVLFSAYRARTHRDPSHWGYSLGLLGLTLFGALWVGWFQGITALWTTTGGASILLAGIAPLFLKFQRQPSELRLATRLFMEVEARAHRKGFSRRPDEGPEAFLQRLKDHLPPSAHPDLEHFTRAYLEVRFGGRPLGPRSYQQLRKKVRSLLRHLQSQPQNRS